MSADPRAASTSPEDLGAILRRRHLPALDGLRAVFVVITYHFFGAPIPGDLGDVVRPSCRGRGGGR